MLPPIQLFAEITTACNLRCGHCYICGGEDVRHLSSRRLHELLAEFQELGGQYVSMSGGDPVLHPGWRPAVRLARALSLPCLLLTNGTNMAPDDIEFVIENDASLAVSVDAASAAAHDAIRGAGAFARTMTAVEYAVARGYGARTTLAFTPMAPNWTELPGVVALARALGIGTVYLSLLERRGRAAARYEHLRLSEEAKAALVFSLLSLQDRYPDIALQCVNLKGFTERLRGLMVDTERLDRTIRITAEGELGLTAYLDADPFRLGSYVPGTLADVWKSSKVRRAYADAATRPQECLACPLWAACRGGSSAFAWVRNDGPGGVDGYCGAKRRLLGAAEGTRR